MATFSWSDTARAAFGSCLPSCLRFSERREEDEDEDDYRQPSATRRDELESLLQGAEFSDAERDGDAFSLHSQIGGQRDGRGGIKRKQARRPKRGSITLFGLYLFGRRPLAEDEEGNDVSDGEYDTTRGSSSSRAFRISSSTLDSDAAPLADDAIAALSAQTAARRETERQERQALRKERKLTRKRQKKAAATLLNVQDGGAFEGFVGSGGGADDFGAFQQAPPASDTELDFVNVRGGGATEIYLDDVDEIPNGEDDPDAGADFDAGAYVRTTAAARSDSGSGSGTRSYSRSRGSASNYPAHEASTLPHILAHRVPLPPSSSGSASPSMPTHPSVPASPSSPRQPKPKRSKRSSGKRSATTGSSSPSQPVSPISAPHIPHVDIASPTSSLGPRKTFEGFPQDDEDDAPAAFAHKLADISPLSRNSGGLLPSPARGGFPSSGLGGRRDSSASTGGNGVFLARTGDDA